MLAILFFIYMYATECIKQFFVGSYVFTGILTRGLKCTNKTQTSDFSLFSADSFSLHSQKWRINSIIWSGAQTKESERCFTEL